MSSHMDYEAVIGLEVHAQLLTKSKIFCGCSTRFGASPMPRPAPSARECGSVAGPQSPGGGVRHEDGHRHPLPDCTLLPLCPQELLLPRSAQELSDLPVRATSILRRLHRDRGRRKDQAHRITRFISRKDAGKLVHGGLLEDTDSSFVDFNRCGVPLMEIVSEPDLRTPEEAKDYLAALKAILEYLEVCDGNMEEGSLRCDANVSVRLRGSDRLGTKVEVKNMNSFRNIQRALDFEIRRQTEMVRKGEPVVQETRLFDAAEGVTLSMRTRRKPTIIGTSRSRTWFPSASTHPGWRKSGGECLSFPKSAGPASSGSFISPITMPSSHLLQGVSRLLRGMREASPSAQSSLQLVMVELAGTAQQGGQRDRREPHLSPRPGRDV